MWHGWCNKYVAWYDVNGMVWYGKVQCGMDGVISTWHGMMDGMVRWGMA